MAAGAVTLRKPPSIHSSTTSTTSRLLANAATMTSGRVVRSITTTFRIGSEARRKARGDHLEEHGRAVTDPQYRRCKQHRAGNDGAADDDGEGDAAGRPSRRNRDVRKGLLVRRFQHHPEIGQAGPPGKPGRPDADHVMRRVSARVMRDG